MLPVVLRIGTFEITSFGVMVAAGALLGLWIFGRELRRSDLPPSAMDTAVAGVLGGLLGAKLGWTLEHLGQAPALDLLLSRGGLSWYGGFAGGVLAGLLVMKRRGLRPVAVLAAATPALAIGHAVGRIGCFLVGDDYGVPSTLPWAVAFPRGLPPTEVPVHPTQLYESGALVLVALVLLRLRRRHVADGLVLGTYLLLAGAVRFLIEFIRVHEPIVGILAVAHLASLLAIVVGAGLVLHTVSETGRA